MRIRWGRWMICGGGGGSLIPPHTLVCSCGRKWNRCRKWRGNHWYLELVARLRDGRVKEGRREGSEGRREGVVRIVRVGR